MPLQKRAQRQGDAAPQHHPGLAAVTPEHDQKKAQEPLEDMVCTRQKRAGGDTPEDTSEGGQSLGKLTFGSNFTAHPISGCKPWVSPGVKWEGSAEVKATSCVPVHATALGICTMLFLQGKHRFVHSLALLQFFCCNVPFLATAALVWEVQV